jgi:hypothetical protein
LQVDKEEFAKNDQKQKRKRFGQFDGSQLMLLEAVTHVAVKGRGSECALVPCGLHTVETMKFTSVFNEELAVQLPLVCRCQTCTPQGVLLVQH